MADLAYILEGESTGFPDGLGVEYKREGGIRGDSRGFGLDNRKPGICESGWLKHHFNES